jgi:hypothetical protein
MPLHIHSSTLFNDEPECPRSAVPFSETLQSPHANRTDNKELIIKSERQINGFAAALPDY